MICRQSYVYFSNLSKTYEVQFKEIFKIINKVCLINTFKIIKVLLASIWREGALGKNN